MKSRIKNRSKDGVPTVVTVEVLRQLVERASAPAVSLYLPLDPVASRSDRNRLTLKGLIIDARRQLAEWPWKESDALLSSVLALLEEDLWWRGPGLGYAHFVPAIGTPIAFRLAHPVAPSVSISTDFSVRELLPAVVSRGDYAVLALSQSQARLFEGDSFGLVEVAGFEPPSGLAATRALYEHSNDLNRHGGSPFGSGVHGKGSHRDYRQGELAEYLRQVDGALATALHDDEKPLVLAADGSVAAQFRAITDHPTVADAFVEGSPDSLSVSELHQASWPVALDVIDRSRQNLVRRFSEALGSASVCTAVGEVVAAASSGRVDVLLVRPGGPVWGHFDADTGVVRLDGDRAVDSEDLINRAVVDTIRHRGTVQSATIDGVGVLGALCRY